MYQVTVGEVGRVLSGGGQAAVLDERGAVVAFVGRGASAEGLTLELERAAAEEEERAPAEVSRPATSAPSWLD